ncbi:AMP-binding protein [Streptomyces sp. NPDC002067]
MDAPDALPLESDGDRSTSWIQRPTGACAVIGEWLARARPDRGIRVLGRSGEWDFRSWSEIAAEAWDTAELLRLSGARTGGTVSLVIDAPDVFAAAFAGTLAAGMVPAPHPPRSSFPDAAAHRARLAGLLRVARPAAVLTHGRSAGPVREAVREAGSTARVLSLDDGRPTGTEPRSPARPAPDATALLQFTSGSSTAPKGVRITWENLTANVAAIRSWLRWDEQDAFAHWLPLHHDMGLIGGLLTPLAAGTDLRVMTPRQFIRAPERWLECFGRHGATLTTAPPFGYAYAARRVRPEALDGMDFSRWRVAILGAERIDPAAVARFHRLVAPYGFTARALTGAYGLAESTLVVSGVPAGGKTRTVRLADTPLTFGAPVTVAGEGVLGEDAATGTGWLAGCGPPLPGTRVTVVDEHGTPLPPGTFGEIRISGTSLFAGYVPQPPRDGREPGGFRTGDSGFLLDGEVYVLGRLGHAMKVRGARVHAEDVEARILATAGGPAPRFAVTFGTTPESAVAAVCAEGEVTPEWADTAARCAHEATAGTARVLVVRAEPGALPRTTSGKPRRRRLWEELADGAGVWRPLREEPPRASSGSADAPSAPGGPARAEPEAADEDEVPGDPARPAGEVGLPSARQLYDRWEVQQWSVARVEVARDAPVFAALRPYTRGELLVALAELEIGESCVTRTLSALADHAPTEADRIYLCTQLADEARHVQFFQRYLQDAAAVAPEALEPDGELGGASGYGRIYAPVLRAATGAVRESGGEAAAWYRAVVHYHLMTEGLLAAPGLRTLRELAGACGLTALGEGLTHVARDEARHLTFGVSAVRAGVRGGHADTVAETYLHAIGDTVRVLVNPGRRATGPKLTAALVRHAAQLSGRWEASRRRMTRQLAAIGLGHLEPRAERAWRSALEAALDAYAENWPEPHPVVRAGALRGLRSHQRTS